MKKLIGLVAGLLIASAAMAAVYVGFNPTTGLNSQQGTSVSVGTLPVIDAATTCGTVSTLQSGALGGASVVQITAGATACTIKLDFPSPAPNGYFCVAADETTVADSMKQSTHDASTCTVTGTVVLNDKILIEVNGF